MSTFVLWIDSREAKIFELVPSDVKKMHMKSHGHKHHTHPHGKQEAGQHHPDSEKFFKEVAETISTAKQVLVMGPGEGKVHFKAYVEKHFKGTLAKVLVGMETVDHPTENQILEKARSFFKEYDLFH